MSEEGTRELIARELGRAAQLVESRLQSPAAFQAWMATLGWLVPAPAAAAFATLRARLAELLDAVRRIDPGVPADRQAAQYATLLARVPGFFIAARDVGTLFRAATLPAGFAEQAPRQITADVVVTHLATNHPSVFALLRVFGLITIESHPAEAARPAYTERALRLDRLSAVLRDPGTVFRVLYAWGQDSFDAPALLDLLELLAISFGVPARRRFPVADVIAYLYPTLGATEVSALRVLEVPILEVMDEDLGAAKVGVSLLPLVGETAAGGVRPVRGLGVQPFVTGMAAIEVPLGGALALALSGSIAADLLVEVRPTGLTVTSRTASGARVGLQASAKVALVASRHEGPIVLLGQSGGTRVEVARAAVALTATASTADIDAGVEVQFDDLRVIVSTAGADGFVTQVMPPMLETAMTVALGWSARRGVYLGGSSTLDATLSLQTRLGPLSVDFAWLQLAPQPDGTIAANVAVSGSLVLGPVAAAIDRVGLSATCAFPPDGAGDLGPLSVALAFRPPSGVGLSIDAGAVTGGGFLAYDRDRAQYSGALHLEAEGIALNAIGLLTTRLPGGQPGYSLLVIVTATGFQPIPLGLGFTLTGVGGLLGINRDVALELLQAGLRSGALDPILFTRDDPTPRAAQIVDTLQAVFPPAPDRHVVGPMAQISWGSPPVLSIDVALLLQFPAPLRLVLLGRLRAALPHDRAAVVLLNMDVFGVIDFDRGTAAVDAVLHDSMVAGFALTGQMAMRISWRQDPGFALAVGGFHPRFAAPPGFPKLQRLALTLAAGDNPRLRLEAYLAITSNTVQLGGRLDFGVRAGEFSLEGVFALDTLVHLAPFELSADLAALLALKQGASVLMAVAVRVALTGPAPWHVHSEASLQVAGLTLPPIPIDATFGEPRPLPLPPAIDLWTEQLQPALGNVGNWTGQLPPGGQGVRLAPQPLAAGEILLHPRGSLTIRQRVVPFDRDLDRFGTRPLAGARRFSIAALLVDGVAQPASALQPVVDDFAPAQFRRLADDEALAAPSFDPMPAGLSVTPAAAASGAPVAKRLVYKTVIRGVTGNRPGPAFALPAERVAPLAAAGAAGTAATRATGRVRFAGAPLGVRVERPGYVVATRSDLRQQAAGDGSYSGAVDALRRSIPAAQRATVQIVRRQEVIA